MGSATRYRASMYALARMIDAGRREVVIGLPDRRRRVEHVIPFPTNEVLNLFLTPATVQDAVARVGPDWATHVSRLSASGLLLTEREWAAEARAYRSVTLPVGWSDVEQPAGTYSTYEDAYAADATPWEQLPLAADLLSLVPLPGAEPVRVLDVGCGTGRNTRVLADLGVRVSGMDISATAVERARQSGDGRVDYVVGSATAIPWPDRSFDVVVDIGCLHCLPEHHVPAYASEVRRVLRADGRFLCRAFKPRSLDVVHAQPVATDRMGYEPAELIAALAPALRVSLVKEGPVHGYYLGIPGGRTRTL